MMLSQHFSLEELSASSTAVRLGIDNTPPPDVVPHLVVLANGLEHVRDELNHPVQVDSGYRCEALERVLCAKDFRVWSARYAGPADDNAWSLYFMRKAHPQGYAGDITCAAFGPPAAVFEKLRTSAIMFDQLILEGDWVHASFAPALRGQVLSATFKDGVPSYN
jgi:putative chitinase